MVGQRHNARGSPTFERDLHPLIEDAGLPVCLCLGNVLRCRLPHPLLVFSIEGRGTLVLPLYEDEEHITSPTIFFSGEHESAVGPLFVAATIEELVQEACAHYRITLQEEVSPLGQHVGVYRGIRFFRIGTWPEPLYLLGPIGSERDTLAMMARPNASGASGYVGRMARWLLDEAQVLEEEEITAASLDQLFRRLLARHKHKRVAAFWLWRIVACFGMAVISIPVVGLQLLLADTIWSGIGVATPPLAALALGLAALLVCLGGPLLILQPLLFPRLSRVLGWRGGAVRVFLLGCLPLLECSAVAYVTVTQWPPPTAGMSYLGAWCACFPAFFAVMVLEMGVEIMLRGDASPPGAPSYAGPVLRAP